MAFVTNLGSTGALNGATLVTKVSFDYLHLCLVVSNVTAFFVWVFFQGTSVGHVSGSTSTHSATVSKIRNQVPIVQKAPGATSKVRCHFFNHTEFLKLSY